MIRTGRSTRKAADFDVIGNTCFFYSQVDRLRAFASELSGFRSSRILVNVDWAAHYWQLKKVDASVARAVRRALDEDRDESADELRPRAKRKTADLG